MRLLRYGDRRAEAPGLLDAAGRIHDLSAIVPDIDASLLASGGLDRVRDVDPDGLPVVEGSPRIGACLSGMSKIVGVGLNYGAHAAEAGLSAPAEPILFLKSTTALNGPFDDVHMPPGCRKLDWEVELAIVIGRTARHVAEADAAGHIAGYAVINDVSERVFQNERLGGWTKGKSSDTFAPLGPWLVTADEVPDPLSLTLRLDVNGENRQHGSTSDMIFGPATLVSYISQFMTLLPGDVIATGTPPGVGLGMKPEPQFLKDGDMMELEIDGLGRQRQTVHRIHET